MKTDKVIISDLDTGAPQGWKRKSTKAKTQILHERIAELQHILFAQGKHSMLIVFQGMDASGKDGATRKTFRMCSPSGVDSIAFKKPTEVEFAHDFLWRIHKHAPQKGMIQIFNRSHYEDILIQRVHGWISEEHVRMRMDAINAFERLLQVDNNTTILKFFMNISPERQLEKLQERIDDPSRNWKHNVGDWEQRKHWDAYMNAYQDVLNECNDPAWIPVPCDKRWYRDYFIAHNVLQALEKLDLELPVVSKEDLKVS